jgi:hypothetical protein
MGLRNVDVVRVQPDRLALLDRLDHAPAGLPGVHVAPPVRVSPAVRSMMQPGVHGHTEGGTGQ